MKVFGAILLAVLQAPLSALITAATMSKLWGWYVAPTYGAGPSYAGWFGLSAILGIAVSPSLMNVQNKETSDDPLRDVIGRTLGTWLGCALVLGACWLTGLVLGWN